MRSSRGSLTAAAIMAACALSAQAFDAASMVWTAPRAGRGGFKPRKGNGSHKANARKQAKSRKK